MRRSVFLPRMALLVLAGDAGVTSTAAAEPPFRVARVQLELGMRVGFGLDGIPHRELEDGDEVFSTIPTPYHVELDVRGRTRSRRIYTSFRAEGFRPVVSGASPWLLTARFGIGRSIDFMDAGGDYERTETEYVLLNKFTRKRCAPTTKYERADPACEPYAIQTKRSHTEPAGPVKGWWAFSGGWRHALDVEQVARRDGDQPDPSTLGSTGGPVIGVHYQTVKSGWQSVTGNVELGYYLTGVPDDTGRLNALARIGYGAPFLFGDFILRLDPVLGTELTFGVTLRLSFDP